MNKNLVLITTTRSGSTWLVDLFDRHPEITMFGEMFHPRKREWFAGSKDFPEYVEYPRDRPRPFAVFDYLNKLYGVPTNEQTVGFKYMYAYLRLYPETIWYLAMQKVASIHLVRENLLDVAISHERMLLSGTVHQPINREGVIWHRAEPNKIDKIHLDPKKTLQFIRKRERQIKNVRKLIAILPGPSIEIKYEALRRNPDEFKKIFHFFGVSQKSESSKLEKIVSKNKQEILENYQEIAASLANTPYRVFLDDV